MNPGGRGEAAKKQKHLPKIFFFSSPSDFDSYEEREMKTGIASRFNIPPYLLAAIREDGSSSSLDKNLYFSTVKFGFIHLSFPLQSDSIFLDAIATEYEKKQ